MCDDNYEGNILKEFLDDRRREQVRYLVNNSNSLLDYDLLQLMLSFVCKDNISPSLVARNLIDTFGSIGKTLNTELYVLKNIKGLNNDAILTILCMKEIFIRVSREEVAKSPILLNNWEALIKYLRVSIGHINYKECLRVIYLNKKYHIISEQMQNIGTIDQTPLYAREIIKHAFMIGSCAIVISHNHPSGDHKPSSADIALTLKLCTACSAVEIELIDHIIITPVEYFSFKEQGILQQ